MISASSLMTSIKTSIEDEALMELAKKGISAKTPVYKGRPDEERKKAINERDENGKDKNTPAETPDSNFLKLHSTL